MSEVGPFEFETKHHVMARVENEEAREVHGRSYLPKSIDVVWRRSTNTGWRAGWVSLYGPQIRKDGSIGTREIHEVLWTKDNNPSGPDYAQNFYWDSEPS